MLRIRKPRNFNWTTIIVVSLIGTLSGIYIYNPLLKRYIDEELTAKKDNKQIQIKRLMYLCVGALSSLTFITIGYKFYVSPYLKRKTYLRNEEFANYVFQQEQETQQKKYESNG
ncbi:unnamed protein product [Chironomus riparius]|uniref:Transmembrane protein n=1 Tax=Chironomus riparius TaxID=315576 RepID=A0A9N9S0R9_9DIPT|nr:unnamed protein product [Chironomus riparius]